MIPHRIRAEAAGDDCGVAAGEIPARLEIQPVSLSGPARMRGEAGAARPGASCAPITDIRRQRRQPQDSRLARDISAGFYRFAPYHVLVDKFI